MSRSWNILGAIGIIVPRLVASLEATNMQALPTSSLGNWELALVEIVTKANRMIV